MLDGAACRHPTKHRANACEHLNKDEIEEGVGRDVRTKPSIVFRELSADFSREPHAES
jgi:hypothetical protein